ncbi:MAG: thioredoxin family protein [Bacillota bacterium]|jgi:thioredoxin 1
MLKTFTEENFQTEVLEASQAVIVKFWSEGCYPCKMMSPVVAEFAEKYADKLIVGEVNTQSNMELAVKYGVSGVPTTMVFKDGERQGEIVGYVDLEDLEDVFKDYLG